MLKEYRRKVGITLKEASNICNVPLRTYIRYEQDENYGNKLKRTQILNFLKEKFDVDEDKGTLSITEIKEIVSKILVKYKDEIDFCYLFGSYVKGYASDSSDVDLCISTTITGLRFVGLIEELRIALHKRVDLIRLSDLSKNIDLIKEIMKDGVLVYKN